MSCQQTASLQFYLIVYSSVSALEELAFFKNSANIYNNLNPSSYVPVFGFCYPGHDYNFYCHFKTSTPCTWKLFIKCFLAYSIYLFQHRKYYRLFRGTQHQKEGCTGGVKIPENLVYSLHLNLSATKMYAAKNRKQVKADYTNLQAWLQ